MKKINQDYINEALIEFELESEPTYGVHSRSSQLNTVDNVIISNEDEKFNIIANILASETNKIDIQIKKKIYKKAFILPGNDVTQDRLKQACAEHDIKITNDLLKADIIITNDHIIEEKEDSQAFGKRSVMSNLSNYYAYKFAPSYLDATTSSTGRIVYTIDLGNQNNFTDDESIWDGYTMPGLAVNAAYQIRVNNVDVVHEDNLLNISANLLELTDQMVEDIENLLKGSDDDRNVASIMVPQIDYTKNKSLLWKLASNNKYSLDRFKRNKDLCHWKDRSDWDCIAYKDATEMVTYLEEREELTSEDFKLLEPYARKKIEVYNRELYTIKVCIKDKYKKYYGKKNKKTV